MFFKGAVEISPGYKIKWPNSMDEIGKRLQILFLDVEVRLLQILQRRRLDVHQYFCDECQLKPFPITIHLAKAISLSQPR